ncbi:MAG: biotin-dependent carboxyltransferase family protein [Bacteroidota bacterium]
MGIEIIKPGILSTLQGPARAGFRYMAIGTGGAMDAFAWDVGNSLVGNDTPQVSLEFFHPGPVLRFHEAALFSITGPGCSGILNGIPVPGWHPVVAEAGAILELPPSTSGRCGYIAIHGGFGSDEFLGSGSTCLAAGAGGFRGRKLIAGDLLERNTQTPQHHTGLVHKWSVPERDIMLVYGREKHISCLEAPETGLLGVQARQDFSLQSWSVSAASNRMGYRLQGTAIKPELSIELVSSPVDRGTVQLLPDGQLIVLMADHQTTGGYPRIGSVVRADLPRLVQAVTGLQIFFAWSSPATAARLRKDQTRRLAAIRSACLLNIKRYL